MLKIELHRLSEEFKAEIMAFSCGRYTCMRNMRENRAFSILKLWRFHFKPGIKVFSFWNKSNFKYLLLNRPKLKCFQLLVYKLAIFLFTSPNQPVFTSLPGVGVTFLFTQLISLTPKNILKLFFIACTYAIMRELLVYFLITLSN